MVQIACENIYKKYDKAENFSVTDFNLLIEDQEFIVLVGPSGCGKSTMLRMIAGLETISQGQLKMNGKSINHLEPKDRDLAMVFQNYALYPHLTVFENMAFSLRIKKMDKAEINRQINRISKMLGLTEYLQRKPAALSGGQRQRVALGRAIVRKTQLFLMDEPLSNLDAKLRVVMRSEIARLHRQLKTTTIYVTHDQTEAMTLADRIVIMKDGFIQQIGTPEEVYNEPANVFVASFIGSPGMNFFDVNFENGWLKGDGFQLLLPRKQQQLLLDTGYVNRKFIMGIRPEDISDRIEKEERNSLHAVVTVAELLGAEKMLHCLVVNTAVISITGTSKKYMTKKKIELQLNLNKLSFFDKETKQRITK